MLAAQTKQNPKQFSALDTDILAERENAQKILAEREENDLTPRNHTNKTKPKITLLNTDILAEREENDLTPRYRNCAPYLPAAREWCGNAWL